MPATTAAQREAKRGRVAHIGVIRENWNCVICLEPIPDGSPMMRLTCKPKCAEILKRWRRIRIRKDS